MRSEILINSFHTIVRKETRRIFRIWPQTLLPSVITQSLYFLIFGGFVGSRVGNMAGVPYMMFIVPGLVMMAVIQNSFMNVVSTFFTAKFMKSIEELMVSPTPPWIMLAGFCTGGIIRGSVTGALVLAVSLFFTRPPVVHPWAIALFLFLTAALFSLGGFLNGIYAKKWDDIGIFSSFVLTPLTYLGGVFYSVSSLPPFWQSVSKLNPILYMVDGFRFGFFGVSGVPVLESAGLLLAGNIVLIIVNLRLLRSGKGMRT